MAGMTSRVSGPDLVIVTGDFVKTGGMDRANYALADYASRAGGNVELVAHRAETELVARPNVTFRRVPKPLDSYVLGEPLLDRAGRRADAAGRTHRAVTVVNGGNCQGGEVNWVHYVHAAYRPAPSLAPRQAQKWLYGLRARELERRALAKARLVLANSAATRRVLIEQLGVPEARAVVVYYGIDATLFAPDDDATIARARAELGFGERPTVAFVGALGDRRKGFDTAFEAWCRLCRSGSWDADLVALGGGSELPVWRARAEREGLSDRIRLLGFRRDVPRMLSACDALVAPTRYEAFGLGVAEAIAKGLPAIVSRSAGVAELYPRELSHLLIDDPESVSSLEQRLLAWRAERAEARQRMRAFSERVRSRGWDDMARDILTLISDRIG